MRNRMDSRSLTEKINEIREQADIVDVIGRHINIVRKGKNYFALCPFHNDNNPSMSISREKQIYKCFVCNEAGNVFTFLQKYKKIPYLEAVKEVADLVGIDFKLKEKNDYTVINPKIKVLYDIMKDASIYYSSCLASNEKAMAYCQSRDMDLKIINEFKIGFSDDFEKVIRFLLAKGYRKEDIYRSGIAIENNGELKDRFAQRLIFPITDLKGNIVAFSGRIIEQSEMAKYVNSPETEIFVKGNTFYHYFDALAEIKKNKSVYICEGFMDVIALCKANIFNAIALMGTAFTKEHLKQLKFLGVDIVLTMDGDIPGNINANKLATELTEREIPVQVVPNYQDVKDVDEFLKKYGKEALLKHLNENKISAFSFQFVVAEKTMNLNNNEEKKQFLKKMCNYIARLDELDQDLYINKLNKELGFSRSTIQNLIHESKEKSQTIITKGHKNVKKIDKMDEMQLRILTQMLDSKEATDIYVEKMIYLENDTYRKIANIIAEYYQEHNDDTNLSHIFADLYTKISNEHNNDEALMNTLSLLDQLKEIYPRYNPSYFEDLIYDIKEIIPIENRLKAIKEEMNYTDLEGQKELVKESVRLKLILQSKTKAKRKNIE